MNDNDHRNNALIGSALRARLGHGAPPPPQSLVQYPVNENLWFNQKVVKLDGWNFSGCRFDGCRLIIETPYFTLKNCYIDDTNVVELQGIILNAAQFINIVPSHALHRTFHPVRHVDGTVSIGV